MNLYRTVTAGEASVLGTVIEALGSTPQKPGCQAWLDRAGVFHGTLGGGLVEAEAVEAMRGAQRDGRPVAFERRLDEAYSRTAGPICGGVMKIFINPRVGEFRGAIAEGLDALAQRRRSLLVTHLGEGNGSGRIECVRVGEGALPKFAAGGPSADELFSLERPALVKLENGDEVFVEPLAPSPRLLVVGGGHVGQAVVQLAAGLGFEITVYDDREEYVDAPRFPDGVVTAHGSLKDLVTNYPKDRDTYIVLVSKGHKPDAEALEACIHDKVAYLGMIGSRRKVKLLSEDFLAQGLATKEEFDRVVAPIGYEIGAITVPEIAVSIVAQLVAARRSPSAVRQIAVKAR